MGILTWDYIAVVSLMFAIEQNSTWSRGMIT